MWTKWHSPRTVEQLTSDEIGYSGAILWDQTTQYTSVKPVSSVARSQGGVLQEGAQSLVFRDFGFDTVEPVLAVEVLLVVTRLARIQDRTVKLWQGEEIGYNRADLTAADQHVYSGDLTWWRVDAVNPNDANFGVLVDLQPHSQYPSRDSIYIREVKIRINYS
jgi:hypothetical protein